MSFPFSRFIIHGNSMLPTLKPGQEVLVYNWAYVFSKPENGDLVIIDIKTKKVIKRVQKAEDNQYFVTGDNWEFSTDSRKFGLIKKNQIIGKVVFKSP